MPDSLCVNNTHTHSYRQWHLGEEQTKECVGILSTLIILSSWTSFSMVDETRFVLVCWADERRRNQQLHCTCEQINIERVLSPTDLQTTTENPLQLNTSSMSPGFTVPLIMQWLTNLSVVSVSFITNHIETGTQRRHLTMNRNIPSSSQARDLCCMLFPVSFSPQISFESLHSSLIIKV